MANRKLTNGVNTAEDPSFGDISVQQNQRLSHSDESKYTQEKLLTPKEFSDMIGLKQSTLAKRRMLGLEPAFVKLGRRLVRYKLSVAMEIMKNGMQE